MFIVQVLAVTYGYRSKFYNSVAIHMHILESIVLSTTVHSFIFGGQRTCPIFCNVHVHNIYTLSKGKPAFFQYCTCSIALNTKKETQRRMIEGIQTTISASLTSLGIPTSILMVGLYCSGTVAPPCTHISTTAGA